MPMTHPLPACRGRVVWRACGALQCARRVLTRGMGQQVGRGRALVCAACKPHLRALALCFPADLACLKVLRVALGCAQQEPVPQSALSRRSPTALQRSRPEEQDMVVRQPRSPSRGLAALASLSALLACPCRGLCMSLARAHAKDTRQLFPSRRLLLLRVSWRVSAVCLRSSMTHTQR